MKRVTISCHLGQEEFSCTFVPSYEMPEYMIADEAWRLALLFAETQAIATIGPGFSMHDLAVLLEQLTYDYKVEEG